MCAVLLLICLFGWMPLSVGKPHTPTIPELGLCRQLVVVRAKKWDSIDAEIRCFERPGDNQRWNEVFGSISAAIGKGGLAWGLGLHGTHLSKGPVKREGDGRAPAGIFSLHEIFGYSTAAEAGIAKFPYRQLTAQTEGIDDPESRFYNRLEDSIPLSGKDWKSSEIMLRADGLYRWGIVVQHNWNQVPGSGSCIFLHVWQGPGRGTAGCTAMPEAHLETIVRWLDRQKHPLLVQLPDSEYERLKKEWSLP